MFLIERLYVDVTRLRPAAEPSTPEWDRLRRVKWRSKRQMDDLHGEQVLMAGTCSQFVEYIYEKADLDLVDQDRTFNPQDSERIYPSTQLRAFHLDSYPLVEKPWREALSRYPACLGSLPPSP
ncbi:Hypothetical protein CAP_3966 [Chondromyces apiculatus DSM 436]|uniref:Uncharacterized protein n=2 Tax=Chondromyces apiculatus TaxID=51 RepID=A0A017THR6_9BACT|nr:Hypothetical protein CAP_3966 [Chondromyces apiculatus DSM 436]